MRTTRYVFLLPAMTFFLSCYSQSMHVQDNTISTVQFYLKYNLGIGKPTEVDTQPTTVTIKDTKVHLYRNYPVYDQMDTTFHLSEKSKNGLISVIKSSNFFVLNERYAADNCHDGGAQTILVHLDSQEKIVSAYCLDEEKNPLYKIINKLYQLIPGMRIKSQNFN